jgi:fatty acid-binding protein DegV
MEGVRTFRRSLERVIELAAEQRPWEKLAVLHANARDKADELANMIVARYPDAVIDAIHEITPAIGVHVGPGALGIMCVRAKSGA